jgi:hypothetical protein
MFDEHDEIDFPALIDAIARPVLGRAQKTELTLPVAEDVRFESGQLADFTD